MLLTHILVALISLGFTTFVYFKPSQVRLNYSYILFALTLLTGIALVVLEPLVLTQACTSGLVYSAIIIFESLQIKQKLQIKNSSI